MDSMSRITAPTLYVVCTMDNLFPAALEVERSDWFHSHGVDVTYHELNSPHKHRGPLMDWEKWAEVLSRFWKTRPAIIPLTLTLFHHERGLG
jgi:homoserine acetyltransferase